MWCCRTGRWHICCGICADDNGNALARALLKGARDRDVYDNYNVSIVGSSLDDGTLLHGFPVFAVTEMTIPPILSTKAA